MEESKSLASELLHELKLSTKRWFIAFWMMVILEIGTIIGFIWYISLPIEEYTDTQTVEDAESSTINQTIGGK